MNKTENKKLLAFLGLAVCLFGVAVTSVSTAAWFAITAAGTNISDGHVVTTGDSNITINNINGYKSVYDEIDTNTKDYSSSHVTTYNVKGVKTTENINQGAITGFDVPSDGVGYYIVGNGIFVNHTLGVDDSSAWKYSASIRMDDDSTTNASNYAFLKGIYLEEGSEFRVRHHYFSGQDVHDDWVSRGIYGSGTYLEMSAESPDNIKVKEGQSGYYNIYLLNTRNDASNNYKIYVYQLEDLTDEILSPSNRRNKPMPRSRLASGDRIYLYTGNYLNWEGTDSGGSRFAICVQDNNFQNDSWVSMTSIGNHYYTCLLPNYNNLAYINFCRMYGDNPTNNWPTMRNSFQFGNGDGWNCANVSGDKSGTSSWYTLTPKLTYGVSNSQQAWTDQNFSDLSTTITLTKGLSFKVKVETTYMGDDFFSNILSYTGYFSGGSGSGDNDIEVIKSCTFTVSFNSTSWNFSVSDVIETKHYANLYVYTKSSAGTYSAHPVETISNQSLTIDENYVPNNPASRTGYRWSIATWYTSYSNSTFSGEYVAGTTALSTNSASPTPLYTYIQAYSVTLTFVKSYISSAGTVNATESGLATKTAYSDTAYALASSGYNTPGSGYSTYKFKGWYSASNGTGTNYGSSRTFTANTTIYAVFEPIDHDVTLIYKFFDEDGETIFSGPSLSNETIAGYENENFAPDTNDFSRYPHDLYGYTDFSTSSYYVFVRDMTLYEDAACSDTYTPGYITSDNVTLYVKMTAKKMTDVIYFDIGNTVSYRGDQWWLTHLYLRFFKDADLTDTGWTGAMPYTGNDMRGVAYNIYSNGTNAKAFSDNPYIYKFRCPVDYQVIISDGWYTYENNSDATSVNQTVNISVGPNAVDSHGTTKGSCDFINIDNDVTGGGADRHYTFAWNNFYGDGVDDGYYLVGSSDFTGSEGVEWSFAAALKMQEPDEDFELPEGIEGTCDAYYEGARLSQGMEFAVWAFSSTRGRYAMYNGNNIASSDTETVGIASARNNNVCINQVDGNRFSIYLIESSIYIRDYESNAYICFDDELESYGDTTAFAMGHGGHTNDNNPSNIFVYEQGIHITADDVANHRSFAIRSHRAGQIKWYGWANGNSDRGEYAQETGSARTYTTPSSESESLNGFEFQSPGYYNIYLTNNAGGADYYQVCIVQMPGDYGEGYYIVPFISGRAADHYVNGIKMKEITTTGATNIAVYTCYTVTDNLKFFTRKFKNGVDTNTVLSGNKVYATSLDSSTDSSVATMTNGVVELAEAGSYNIYITRESNGHGTLSITKYDSHNFFTLNSINNALETQEEIKDARTGIVLEVDFSISSTGGFSSEAIAEMVASGSGSSQYLAFTYSVVTNTSGSYTDNYSDYDNCYEYMYAKHYIGESNGSRNHPTNLVAGQHKMLILIDYDINQLSGLSSAAANNFYFIIRSRQTT